MMQWLTGISDWSGLIWGAVLTAFVFVATASAGAILAAVILVKMPATYFCDHYVRDFWVDRHPVLRWIARIAKNFVGAALIAMGCLLSFPGIPGPGIITILFGITLLDFPGKRRLERWLIGRPVFLRAINRLRCRYGKPPVVLDHIKHADCRKTSKGGHGQS